ncbi:hypothetical protein [Dickeya zeae]|uniref:hypothetical protein n=1 Tax=Dickeya zeae TaxID=204042 RepID=UPI0003C7E61B|nr:hypothetical protein [Dickeya zeae]
MNSNIMDVVAEAHHIYSIANIVYDITYGRTAVLLKKTYNYWQEDNYQDLILCGLLAMGNIAFVIAVVFVFGPWVKALLVSKFAASPLVTIAVTSICKTAVREGFGMIVDTINRKFL